MPLTSPGLTHLDPHDPGSYDPTFGRRFALLVLVMGLAMVLSMSWGVRVARSAGIAVHSSTASSSFPNGIVFRVSASSDARISEARLSFQILPTGPITEMGVGCSGGTRADCSKTVGGANGIYIVPFTQVRYSWDAADRAVAPVWNGRVGGIDVGHEVPRNVAASVDRC